MTTITLIIGHNVADIPTYETADICEAVSTVLGIEAFTAIPCYGMWRGVAESSTRIEIATDAESAANIMAEIPFLAHLLHQEAIMAERRETDVDFITSIIAADAA